jgi:YbbR domain-containing protein
VDQKSTWLIKICCVIAACSLWLYIINETNTQKTQNILVPVELTNLEIANEKGYALLPGQQFNISLDVNGSTADIASGKSQFKVVADMGLYVVTKGDNYIPIRVDRQPVNVKVLNSQALFVKVTLDDLIKKTFPVKVNLSGKVKEGYYSYPQSIAPTEVEVSGAAKYVNQVVAIEAKSDLRSSDKDLNMKLPLRALDAAGKEIKDVTISPDTVEVIVPVKKIKTVPITVETKGTLNKIYSMKGILVATPDKVEIAGDETSVNNVTSLKTEQVDLSTLTPNKTVVAKIILPPGVTLLDSDGTVKVKATLDNVINKTFQGLIQLKNINEAYTAVQDISKLVVEVNGPEEIINALKNEDFDYIIDGSSFTEEKEHTININVKVPEGLTKVSQTPQSVKVTVKKKETQPTATTPAAPTT